VTRLGLGILKQLGFPQPLPLPQAQVEDAHLKYGNYIIHVRSQPQFVVFHRLELDAYLAEQARLRGAVICEDEPAISLEMDQEGVTVNTNRNVYRARAVVAADGSKGIARQTLLRGETRQARIRTARLLETLCRADEQAEVFTQRSALFDFTPMGSDLQGYCWDFPARVGGQATFNRGIYDAHLAESRPRAHLPALLAEFQSTLPSGIDRGSLEGHPIHWFSPRNRLAFPRLLLTGDAAGADPLFGEGIAPALGYGQVAAQVIQQAFASGDFSFNQYRPALRNSAVGRYLMARWFAAEGVYRMAKMPGFVKLVWMVGDGLARILPRPADLY
jgi:flavin-dependent dehydrogenase